MDSWMLVRAQHKLQFLIFLSGLLESLSEKLRPLFLRMMGMFVCLV